MAGKVSDRRVSVLIEAPEVALPSEVLALAQEVIDSRQSAVAQSLNQRTIEEQQVEIVRQRARIEVLTKMVAETPVDVLVANVKAASAGASKTAHGVELEAHEAER